MSTTDRPDANAPAASDIAAQLREAGFVRLVAAPTGDAVAATGLLARALDGTPYQATVASVPGGADRDTDADLTVALGGVTPQNGDPADVHLGETGGASRAAFRVAQQLAEGVSVREATLVLAGLVAAGEEPAGEPLERADLSRRPGLAVPTADPADGLAHSTLVHGPFSGDVTRAAEFLEGGDEGGRRRASLVALAVAEASTARGATAVERVLRPYVGGPVETVGGYADVLDALAQSRPGLAVALALGTADTEAVLEAWRTHARQAHAAVREATTARYDGALVAKPGDDAPLGTVARLLAAYRSPEPVVLALADGEAAAHAVDGTDAGRAIRAASGAVGASGAGTPREGRAVFEGEPTEFAVAFREAL